MNYFRQRKKRTLFLWAFLLSTVLLCVQGVKLQLHAHDIDHDQQYSHIVAGAAVEHLHRREIHFSTDVSHDDHHDDEVVSEFDASPYGLLKKVSNNVLMLVLLATVFTFLLRGFYQQTFQRRCDNGVILPWRYLLFPPLRAPPL